MLFYWHGCTQNRFPFLSSIPAKDLLKRKAIDPFSISKAPCFVVGRTSQSTVSDKASQDQSE